MNFWVINLEIVKEWIVIVPNLQMQSYRHDQ